MCTICSLTVDFNVEHPESLSVAVATRAAIDGGSLPELPVPDGATNMWWRHDAITGLTAIQTRLEQVLSPAWLLALPTFYVLMVESRTWGYFRPTSRGFDTRADPPPPCVTTDGGRQEDAALVLSQTATRQLLPGKLSFDHAKSQGLVAFSGPSFALRSIVKTFELAYPISGFSNFACTEAAL